MVNSSLMPVPSSQKFGKLFWIISAGNVTVCILLLVYIYLIVMALAAFAAGVEVRPAFGLLVIGVFLSVISWPIVRSASTRRKRLMGYVLNGAAFLVYLMLVITIGVVWLNITHRLFLVPSGFQGDLYVVHDSKLGQNKFKSFFRKTYIFPNDGVLLTDDPEPTSFSDEYRYVYPDGHQQKLNDAGPGTLPDTPENRANTSEVVTYFPRSSPSSEQYHCSVEEISIGTRAFILSRHSQSPPPETTHPGICK